MNSINHHMALVVRLKNSWVGLKSNVKIFKMLLKRTYKKYIVGILL